MKNEYVVGGMSCGHCRAAVEKALNAVPGVSAVVTLDPPVAVVCLPSDEPVGFDELRRAVAAVGYSLSER